MLEQQLIDQLKDVYKDLKGEITLAYFQSDHQKFADLLEMLEEVASTSEKIKLEQLNEKSEFPEFKLKYQGKENGISFLGIPGGHEFTSLILAILNSDSQGKLPDQGIIKRIQRLKGPIKLRTFISLSCENCPEVVQALNLMSIYHDDFEHQMIDGAFVQEEIDKLKVQGVPSVMDGDKLVSAGKMSVTDILSKLEEKFGVNELKKEDRELGHYDVVVIGGGPAGASSAIYTARKGLKTAVIAEKIGGQVQDTKGIENLISVPYTEGPELSAQLAKHMNEYDIDILEHRRVKNVANDSVKIIELDSGESLKTKALIVATGAKWKELNVPGEKDYLGRGVAYCPHCDGPMFKGKDIAVIGGGNSGVEAAIDLAGIVKSVTLLEFGEELRADQVLIDKLESLPNTKIIKNARTTEVLANGEKVVGLEYEDRRSKELIKIELEGIFVQIGLSPNSQFIKDLVETNKFGEIIVDEKNRTNIKGIYAAGDVTTIPYKQIIISMGEGAKAGLAAFDDQMIE